MALPGPNYSSNEQIGRQQTTSWDMFEIPPQAAANRCQLEHVTCSAPIPLGENLRGFERVAKDDVVALCALIKANIVLYGENGKAPTILAKFLQVRVTDSSPEETVI